MPAPKGNEYWEFRNKHGAPFAYNHITLWKEFEDYCAWITKKTWFKNEAIKSGDLAGQIVSIPTTTPMSIESFCIFADIVRQTFINYERAEDKDLMEVATRIRHIIETQQFEGATVGAFNQSIIAAKLGLASKTDITTNGENLPAQTPIIQVYNSAPPMAGSEDEIQ